MGLIVIIILIGIVLILLLFYWTFRIFGRMTQGKPRHTDEVRYLQLIMEKKDKDEARNTGKHKFTTGDVDGRV